MKKKLVIAVLLVLIILAGALLFIPKKIKVSSSVTYAANAQGVFNFLTDQTNWEKWWPGKISGNEGKLVFNFSSYNFYIDKMLYNACEINFEKDNKMYTGLMKIVSLKVDGTGVEFTTEIDAGTNPINRIANYFDARKIKKVFNDIVNALAQYTQSVKNVYGFDIRNEKVQMQYLLSASKLISHYPSTQDIYSLIEKIRAYIKTTDGAEEFHPMLNIEKTDSMAYLVRVGLPVNKNLPETKGISVKQMVKNGNILVTEVTGDSKTIELALKQMEKYISDYERSVIAIPFQSLETDRTKVTDSTKWVTKIFYPVV